MGGKKEGGRARDKRDGRKGRGKGEGGREKREGGKERVEEREYKREGGRGRRKRQEEGGRGRESVNVGVRQCLGNRVTIALHSRLHVLPHTFSLHMYTHTHLFPTDNKRSERAVPQLLLLLLQ